MLRKNFNYIKVNDKDYQFKVREKDICFYALNDKKAHIVKDKEIFGRSVYRFAEHFFETHVSKIIEAKIGNKPIPNWEQLYKLQFQEIIV